MMHWNWRGSFVILYRWSKCITPVGWIAVLQYDSESTHLWIIHIYIDETESETVNHSTALSFFMIDRHNITHWNVCFYNWMKWKKGMWRNKILFLAMNDTLHTSQRRWKKTKYMVWYNGLKRLQVTKFQPSIINVTIKINDCAFTKHEHLTIG